MSTFLFFKSLLKSIIKDLNLDDKAYKPGNVLGRISSAKNNLISPQAYAQNADIIAEDKMAKREPLLLVDAEFAIRRAFEGMPQLASASNLLTCMEEDQNA